MRRCGLGILTSVVFLASCDEGEASSEFRNGDVVDIDEPASDYAEVLATAFVGDVELTIIAAEDNAVAIVWGGPIDSATMDEIPVALASSASPLEFFQSVAPEVAVSEAFVLHSQKVVADHNWKPGSADADAEAFEKSRQIAPPMAQDGSELSVDAPPLPPVTTLATCDNLFAYGEGNLDGDWGNCTLYHRDAYEETHWLLTDVVATGGHVIGDDGVVSWLLQKKNCGTCGWTELYSKIIAQGYHYYWHYSDLNNDFTSDSLVTSLSNGGSHYHDVAQCHDYWHRTITGVSYLAGGCGINYSGSTLFCTELEYYGADPSVITTSGSWAGNGANVNCN